MESEKRRTPISEIDPRKALYELMSYQEELERQYKELEEAQKKNEQLLEKYTMLYDYAPSGYLTLDRSGTILELNLYALTYLYKERSQLINTDFKNYISTDSHDTFNTFLIRIFQNINKVTCEIKLFHSKENPVHIHLEGIASDDGKNCLISMVDITILKRMEYSLMLSKKEFQSYFENGTVGMSVTSPKKGWIELNQKFCQMLGYTKKELLGINWMSLSHPDDLPANLEFYQQALEGKIDKYQMDKRFIRKDGTILYVTLAVSCQRNQDGNVHHLLASYVDITDHVLAEKALKEDEASFKALFEESPDAIILADVKNGIIIDVNYSATKLMNINAEKMKGMHHSLIYPERYKELSETIFQKSHSKDEGQGSLQPVEISVLRSDGKEIPVEILTEDIIFNRNYVREIVIRDISKRIEAEAALRESERRYRLIAENSGDIIWIFDLNNMRVKYISPSIFRVHGDTAEEIMEREFSSSLFPGSAETVRSKIEERIEEYRIGKREIYIDEVEQPCKNGSVICTEISTKIIQDEEDGHLLLLGVSRDITKRKVAERKLRDSQERYHALFRTSPDAILLADISSGLIIDANNAASKLLGRSKEEIIGLHHYDIRPSRDIEYTRRTFQERGKKSEKSNTFGPEEIYLVRSDGTEVPVEFLANIVTIDSKPVFQAIFHDLTIRKQAEEALRKNEERLSEINKSDWVWEVDNNGVYTYTSQTGIDYFGYSEKDIIGKTPFDFMPPEEAERVAGIFSELVAVKAPIKDLENWNIKKNGELCCVLTNGVPILDEDGNLLGYRGVDKDITRYRQTIDTLKQKLAAYERYNFVS